MIVTVTLLDSIAIDFAVNVRMEHSQCGKVKVTYM